MTTDSGSSVRSGVLALATTVSLAALITWRGPPYMAAATLRQERLLQKIEDSRRRQMLLLRQEQQLQEQGHGQGECFDQEHVACIDTTDIFHSGTVCDDYHCSNPVILSDNVAVKSTNATAAEPIVREARKEAAAPQLATFGTSKTRCSSCPAWVDRACLLLWLRRLAASLLDFYRQSRWHRKGVRMASMRSGQVRFTLPSIVLDIQYSPMLRWYSMAIMQ